MSKREEFPVIYAGTDKFIDMDAYLRAERDALLMKIHAIEKALEIEPKVRAICPHCEKEWNKREETPKR